MVINWHKLFFVDTEFFWTQKRGFWGSLRSYFDKNHISVKCQWIFLDFLKLIIKINYLQVVLYYKEDSGANVYFQT